MHKKLFISAAINFSKKRYENEEPSNWVQNDPLWDLASGSPRVKGSRYRRQTIDKTLRSFVTASVSPRITRTDTNKSNVSLDAGCIEDLLPGHAGYAGGFRAYRVCRVTDSEFSKYPGIAAIANPDQPQLSTAPINLDGNEPLSAFPLLFVFISEQCRNAVRCLEDIVVDKLTLTNFQADHRLIRWKNGTRS